MAQQVAGPVVGEGRRPPFGVSGWAISKSLVRGRGLIDGGGDSLLVEYRIRPQVTNISRANGFTMAIGCLLDWKPHFRSYKRNTEI
jgi:hypothetical protein